MRSITPLKPSSQISIRFLEIGLARPISPFGLLTTTRSPSSSIKAKLSSPSFLRTNSGRTKRLLRSSRHIHWRLSFPSSNGFRFRESGTEDWVKQSTSHFPHWVILAISPLIKRHVQPQSSKNLSILLAAKGKVSVRLPHKSSLVAPQVYLQIPWRVEKPSLLPVFPFPRNLSSSSSKKRSIQEPFHQVVAS